MFGKPNKSKAKNGKKYKKISWNFADILFGNFVICHI